ncbi:MAG: polyphosphate kinase 1 [Planctomycetia bacterium]|nr:polyphosphate kinase 1 [Planctomycetia bacterium]
MRKTKTEKKLVDLYDPKYYIPRDLSWLEFNERVLLEGLNPQVPLAERLNFLAITGSNLDEFFKVRVAAARQIAQDKNDANSKAAEDLLEKISKSAHTLVEEQSKGIADALGHLSEIGIRVLRYRDMDRKSKLYLRSHFEKNILPILSSFAVDDLNPMPLWTSLQLIVALYLRVPAHLLQYKDDEPATESRDGYVEKLAFIPVPTQLSRLVVVTETEEQLDFVMLEHLIVNNADLLCPGCEILSHTVFRITRDEDVAIEETPHNYAQQVHQAVQSRKRRDVVRLEMFTRSDKRIRERLMEMMNVTEQEVYESSMPLDVTVLGELARVPRLAPYQYEPWAPVPPADLTDAGDIYERIQQDDVLLFHPYEQFTPVVELLEKAASDPDVMAIKQTLYRTSGNSPIVKALIKAANNGKEVVVLVELRARFDEERNIRWTEQLENAGCHVIYGISGFKTHAKAMLIIRREKGRIQRYVHLSTGNYNDKTAKLYSDIGLMTANREITADVAAFFNLLTGYSECVGWNRLTVEPVLLKRKFIELIEREITVSTPEQPGQIRVKLNSLEDRDVIEALYRASRKGVKIDLNIRGICCLRPGIAGISDNIRVTSIIDRYLEHSRIFYFRNGGDEEVYLASADWMTRNLEHRLEILFPVLSPPQKQRVLHFLDVYFSDNVKARWLDAKGEWKSKMPRNLADRVRAQEVFHLEAVEAQSQPIHPPLRYIPLVKPKEDE